MGAFERVFRVGKKALQAGAVTISLLQPAPTLAQNPPSTTIGKEKKKNISESGKKNTIEKKKKSVSERLMDEIRNDDLPKGFERIMGWANKLPFEISISYIEPGSNARIKASGRWRDLRGGEASRVTTPDFGPNDVLMRHIKQYARETGETKLRVCFTHTHISNDLRLLKRGKIFTNERRGWERLGIVETVPFSVDPRGFVDSFDEKGPYGMPPSIQDLNVYKEFVPGLRESAQEEGIELEVEESVTTALGVWYFRACREGECAIPNEPNPTDEAAIGVNFFSTLARWVLYVNKEKPSDTDILTSSSYNGVLQEYERRGFKAWLVTEKMLPRLKNCGGEIE